MKMTFHDLHSLDSGILNHTRLLHSVVTGALGSPGISVHHILSRSVGPFSIASMLLVCSSQVLSLPDSATRLQTLLNVIEEISAVEIQDTDECAQVTLHSCSADADCMNTEGTYSCTCRPGFIDMDINNTGIHCRAASRSHINGSETKLLGLNNVEIIMAPSRITGANVTSKNMLLPNDSDSWMAVMGTPEVWSTSSPSGRAAAITTDHRDGSMLQSTSTSLQTTVSSTDCPAAIVNVTLVNITGSAFHVTWAVNSTANHTFRVELLEVSLVVRTTQTDFSAWGVTGLEPGVLYTVQITPVACGARGVPVERRVKTVAQTLSATARLTNLMFREAFLNSSSEEYIEFCQSIEDEILSSLPANALALVTSGAVRIHILSLSKGSVVVNLEMVFSPDKSLDIVNVSSSLLKSLQNSSLYDVEFNISDFDECSWKRDDCSPFATCVNQWSSYTCLCREGYTDTNLNWPGRSCLAIALPPSSSPAPTTALSDPTDSGATLNSTKSTSAWDTLGHSHTGAITVQCRATEISVIIAREFLQARNIAEASLYLGTPGCSLLKYNATHVELTVVLGRCKTQFQHNSTHNTAHITLFSDGTTGSVTIPKFYLEIPIVCTFKSDVLISSGYTPVGYTITDMVEGYGTFHVTFQLFNGSQPFPQNYTLSPGDEVIIEIGINSTLPEIKLIVNKCWATPTSDPLDSKRYTFLESSCPVLRMFTTVLENGNSSTSRLAIRIFSAVDEPVIFLHCQIQICIETEASACKTDCMQRAARSANVVGTSRASCGPIFKSAGGSTNPTSIRDVGYIILGVGLFLLCLLLALALIFYYRNRIGRYNFGFKPKQEKFTYHIFDT